MKKRLLISLIMGTLLFSCKEKEEIEPSCCEESEQAVIMMHSFLQGLWSTESEVEKYYNKDGHLVYSDTSTSYVEYEYLYYGDSLKLFNSHTKEAYRGINFKVFFEDCKYYTRIGTHAHAPDMAPDDKLEIRPISSTSFVRIEGFPISVEYRPLFKGATRGEVVRVLERK
ncbi:hypothetical protein [Pontibacter ummariensis]|nr:hypothetical protein [Pontibacter ummariensis]